MVATKVREIIEALDYDVIYSYDLFDSICNRNALYVAMNRLVKDEVIGRYAKGRFYRLKDVQETLDGKVYKSKVALSNRVVWDDLLGDGGFVVGAALYNSLGISTQIPVIVDIASSSLKGTITREGRKVRYIYSPLKANDENRRILELIYVVSNKDAIMDIIDAEFERYVKQSIADISTLDIYNLLSKLPIKMQRDFIRSLPTTQFSMSLRDELTSKIIPQYQQATL